MKLFVRCSDQRITAASCWFCWMCCRPSVQAGVRLQWRWAQRVRELSHTQPGPDLSLWVRITWMISFLKKTLGEKREENMGVFYHFAFLFVLKKFKGFTCFFVMFSINFGKKTSQLPIFRGLEIAATLVQTTKLWITRDYLWISAFHCGEVLKGLKISITYHPQIWTVVWAIPNIWMGG